MAVAVSAEEDTYLVLECVGSYLISAGTTMAGTTMAVAVSAEKNILC